MFYFVVVLPITILTRTVNRGDVCIESDARIVSVQISAERVNKMLKPSTFAGNVSSPVAGV